MGIKLACLYVHQETPFLLVLSEYFVSSLCCGYCKVRCVIMTVLCMVFAGSCTKASVRAHPSRSRLSVA